MEFFKLNPHGASYSHRERKELKEQDLIKSLEENTLHDDGSDLDCSLSLGRPDQTQMNHRNNLWSNIHTSNAHTNNDTSQYRINSGSTGEYGRPVERFGGHYNWLVGSPVRMLPEIGNDPHSSRFFSAGTSREGINSSFSMRIQSKSGEGESRLNPRKCSSCQTTSTPLWGNGPNGSKSLCNACGIRFKKEERRALHLNASKAKHGIFNIGGLQRNNDTNDRNYQSKKNHFE